MSDETKGHCCGGCHGAGFVSEGDEDQDCDACDGSGISGTKDWPAFWASLTDADAAACLRAAPRVAGEWESDPDSVHPTGQRRQGGCSPAAYLIPVARVWEWWLAEDESLTSREPTAALARSACDAALRAAGWRVL